MSHDPMHPNALGDGDGCRVCAIIARVREDEVERASVVIANMTTELAEARAAALRDAVEAVKALSHSQDCGSLCASCDAVAAIEALGGER